MTLGAAVPFARLLSPAWILAGLVFFTVPLHAEDPPPGRHPAPSAGSGQAISSADLQALKDSVESAARQHDERLQETARRLSRVAASVDEGAASLKAADEAQSRLQSAVEGLRSRLDSVEKKAQNLDEAAGRAAVGTQAQDTRLSAFAKDLSGLKQELSGSRESLDVGMKEFAATKAELKERSAKLESLSDLLSVMKRDVENNNEELVEVKQSLKRLEAAPVAGADADNAAWWDQALRWKYLPAVATGLSVVAVGVAAFHK